MEACDTRPVQLGEWTQAETRVAFVGDSTLDNIIWIGDAPCISEQLSSSLPCAVSNLAADGFNSMDAVNGSRTVISVGLRREAGDPVEFSEDGVFRPLERLKALTPPPTHIVLSIGGNDVREILGRMEKLPEIMQRFWQNYPELVKACADITPNVILMFQYRPSLSEDFHYGVYRAIGSLPGPESAIEKLNGLMVRIYQPIRALARTHGLAIVDLPRTFDVNDPDLYCSQIEPSAKGGAIISKLLGHTVLKHTAGKPSTYYRLAPCSPEDGEVIEEANDDGTEWVISP